jgi:hypothetical protein
MRPLSPPEARRFLDSLEGHSREPLFVLEVTTGMRRRTAGAALARRRLGAR